MKLAIKWVRTSNLDMEFNKVILIAFSHTDYYFSHLNGFISDR